MPSGLAFLSRKERGGLIREEGLITNFNLQTRGLLERGRGLIRERGLIRAFTVYSLLTRYYRKWVSRTSTDCTYIRTRVGRNI